MEMEQIKRKTRQRTSKKLPKKLGKEKQHKDPAMDKEKRMENEKDQESNGNITLAKQNTRPKRKEETKQISKLATWNVRGLNGKENELADSLGNTNFEAVAITETKRKGKGTQILDSGDLLIYSGVKENVRARAGVACLIPKKNIDHIQKWETLNERIMNVIIQINKTMIVTLVIVYAPNEDAKSQEKDEFWTQLQQAIENYTGTLIILGDLNARVGNESDRWQGAIGKHGEEECNGNGKRLIEFCIDNDLIITNTFFEHLMIHKITREVPQRNEKSIIDYIIIKRENRKMIKDTRVKRSYEIGSDHYLLETKLKQKISNLGRNKLQNVKPVIKERIRIYKLRETDNRRKYTEITEDKFTTCARTEHVDNIDEKWAKFKEILINGAIEVCGYTRKSNRKQTSWWSEDIRKEVKEKKKAWELYIQQKNQWTYNNYKIHRNKVKTLIKEAKKQSWEEFGQKMEENSRDNQKLFYKVLKNMRNKKEPTLKHIYDQKGKVITQEPEILERWKEYFNELLNEDLTSKSEEKIKDNNKEELKCNIEEKISMHEVEEALLKLKNGKASGCDGVEAELLKYLGPRGIHELQEIYNLAWTIKRIPEEWRTAIILPIHKSGDTKDCGNYRGISLLCIALKTYESIVEKKLRDIVEPKLIDTQSGFRPAHCVQDHIFTLQQLIEKALVKEENICLGFLDMEKAFDRVNRNKIWESLEKKEVDKDLIDTIKSLYHNTKNVIRTCNKTSEVFANHSGVRQGGVLSPLLFICAMDEVMQKIWAKTSKYSVGYNKLKVVKVESCAFADDVVAIAKTEKELQNNINIWAEELKTYNLVVNMKKTKVMSIGNNNLNINIKLNGHPLEQVTSYKYLGILINNKGSQEEEIGNRIKTATRTYHALSKGFLNNKKISNETKMTIYQTVYLPVLMYGAENWILNNRTENRLQATEMKYLRKVLGINIMDKRRNTEIREELSIEPLKEKLDKKKLKWAGHLLRMGETRQVKMVWEAKRGGKNRRGRPRKTWNTSIAEILKRRGSTWQDARALAKDRKNWRRFVEENH